MLKQGQRTGLRLDVVENGPHEALLELQAQAREVRTAPALIDYILALLRATREHPGLRQGLSPRAGLSLRRAAQAYALLDARGAVIPEDVQAVFAACVGHRLIPATESDGGAPTAEEILAGVAIP